MKPGSNCAWLGNGPTVSVKLWKTCASVSHNASM